MASKSARDVAQELTELEIEEARIMRELREMDEKATVARLRGDGKADPRRILNALLGECEREVREAKGFIKSTGPPLLIARCKRGETVPAHATFLSRPKSTGVDFTTPVKLKEYNDAIRTPIFLDTIRDKCNAMAYNSHDEYMADMRLLARNTAAFNKGAELSWVVQHAKLLVETADESVMHRRRELQEAAAGVARGGGPASARTGKRKRASAQPPEANGSALAAVAGLAEGQAIQIFWDSDRKWYRATVKEKGEGAQVFVEYEHEGKEWLDLEHEVKWRVPPATSSGRSRRIAENAHKRKKGSSSTSGAPSGAVPPRSSGRHAPSTVVGGVNAEALHAVRDEVLQAVDDAKGIILNGVSNTVESRFVGVENALNRSDALHRVLLAVTDMQAATTADVQALSKTVESLQLTVAELTGRLGGKVATPPTVSADVGGTEKAAEEEQGEESEAVEAGPPDTQGVDGEGNETAEIEKSVAVEKATDAPGDAVEKAADASGSESVKAVETEKAGTSNRDEADAKEVEEVEKEQGDDDGDVVIVDADDTVKERPAAPAAAVAEKDLAEKDSVIEVTKDVSESQSADGTVAEKAKEVVEEKDSAAKEDEAKDAEMKDGDVEQNGVAESEKKAGPDAEEEAGAEANSKDDVATNKEVSDDVQVDEAVKKAIPGTAADGSPKKRSKSKSSDSDSSSSSSSSDVSSSSEESGSSVEKKNGDASASKKEENSGKELRRSASDMSVDNAVDKKASPPEGEKAAESDADAMDITQESLGVTQEAGGPPASNASAAVAAATE